jgi:hypothetical protein
MGRNTSIVRRGTTNPLQISQKEANISLYRLALLGMTNEEIAEFFGVEISLFKQWLDGSVDMQRTLRNGRAVADGKVVAALHKRAIGMERVITKRNFTRVKNEETGEWEEVETSRQEIIEELPPDVGAAQFWLKNKAPKAFKEKQEVEHNVSLSWADMVMEAVKPRITVIDNPPQELPKIEVINNE